VRDIQWERIERKRELTGKKAMKKALGETCLEGLSYRPGQRCEKERLENKTGGGNRIDLATQG